MKTITVKFTICDKKYHMTLTFNLFAKARVCLYEECEKRKNITPLKNIPVIVQYTGIREEALLKARILMQRLNKASISQSRQAQKHTLYRGDFNEKND